MHKTEIRIFLGSPSADTTQAREQVARVVRELNADSELAKAFELRLCRWDDPDRPVAQSAAHNPQVDVLEQVGHPGQCDLVIGLFRHTMGGTLPADRYGLHPQGRLWHCTEWEMAEALKGRQAGQVREVWIYRDTSPFDAVDDAARVVQLHRVAAYFKSFRDEAGSIRQGFNNFSGVDDLASRLRHELREWIYRTFGKRQQPSAPLADGEPASDAPEVLSANQQALRAALAQGPGGPDIPRELLKSALADRVTGLQGHLLQRYVQGSTGAGGQLDRRFVNLTLMLDRGLDEERERLVPDTRMRPDGRYDDLAELLAAHADVPAWVLVGDPGSGKSTLLQHHELVTAARALQALSASDAEATALTARPEVCVWQRLSEYSVDSPPPAQWLSERWAAQPFARLLPPWPVLQQRLRLRFLLDGLNEIKAPDRAAQLEAIDRWAQWVAQTAGQAAPPIFTVRTLELSPLGSGGLEVRQITLAAWSPQQMQDYCAAVLGEDNALWPAIEGDAHQLSLCSLPFNLKLQCELFAQLQRPARDRAELFSGLFWLRLRRQQAEAALKAPGLLDVEDRQRLAGDQWKKAVYALPSRGCLVPWLEAVAEQMHRDGREVSLAQGVLLQRLQALRERTTGRPAPEPAAWLHAVQGLGLIGEGSIDPYTGEPSLRFTHQLWQEYFAGRSLRGLPARPPEHRPDLQPPPLPDLDEVLGSLGKSEPLPGPDPSHWEEAVKLGVQLSPDPVPWLRVLQPLNLALAGRAAAGQLHRLEPSAAGREALASLRTALLQRSRDPAVDLRLRIEAAEALGPLGDPRYEEGRGPEGHRYLLPRREHWVRIPAGRYVIGSEDTDQPDEQPPTPVELEAFDIAFAPVTNAEFACFVDAGGYEDERWWVGDAALRWWRGEWRNDALIEEWTRRHADMQGDFDAVVGQYANLTEAQIETWRQIAELSESDALALFEEWYGAEQHRKPLDWDNPRFNQPLQPVVGVSVFEAQAYLRWLTVQTGQTGWALPTEAQWEAAARGEQGRAWPWERPDEPASMQINADPAHLRRTSPIGVFVEGDSRTGLADMAGNVWEWTLSGYTPSLQADALVAEAPEPGALRAVRGGSWGLHPGDCRAGYRDRYDPDLRGGFLGFRVVCCPILGP